MATGQFRPATFVLIVVILAAAAKLMSGSPALGSSVDPARSVFPLLAITRDSAGRYTGAMRGSAFFISADGMALTNGSIVYPAVSDPEHAALVAIVGNESYAATVVCANVPPYDPAQAHPLGVPLTHDVAEVVLGERSPLVGTVWVTLPDGPTVTLPPAHQGALPAFAPLAFGPDPQPRDRVSVIWIDRGQLVPAASSAIGTVEDTSAHPTSALFMSADFTPIFRVALTSQAARGNSGAPILNENNEVVGIWTWYSPRSATVGVAISSSALVHQSAPPARVQYCGRHAS